MDPTRPFEPEPPAGLLPGAGLPAAEAPFIGVRPTINLRMSAAIDQIADALAKAQATLTQPGRDRAVEVQSKRTGESYGYSYATLHAIIDAVRPAYAAQGIAIVQAASAKGTLVVVSTMLLHTSGQWLASTLQMTAASEDPQALGSCMTYGRRYGLSPMTLCAADEDDDGTQASVAPVGTPLPAGAPRPTPPRPANKPISPKQQAWLEREMKKHHVEPGDVHAFLREKGLTIAEWGEIAMSAFDDLIAFVKGELNGTVDEPEPAPTDADIPF